MNLQVRILATVVVAISPLSMLSLHAQRMASLFDIATDGNGQSSTSSPQPRRCVNPGARRKSIFFLATPTFAPCRSWRMEIGLWA